MMNNYNLNQRARLAKLKQQLNALLEKDVESKKSTVIKKVTKSSTKAAVNKKVAKKSVHTKLKPSITLTKTIAKKPTVTVKAKPKSVALTFIDIVCLKRPKKL